MNTLNTLNALYIVTFDDGEYGYGLIQDRSRAFTSYDEAVIYVNSLVGKKENPNAQGTCGRLSELDMHIKQVQLG